MPKPCSNCYITAATPSLVYWSGNPVDPSSVANYANGPMLHHFVLWNQAKIDATCAGTLVGAFGDRFFASGNERTTLSLPSPYGYQISPTANWNLNVHIHNTAPVPKTVYVEVAFTWEPASANLKDVRNVWLDENNCASSQYQICTIGPYPCYDDRHADWTSGTTSTTPPQPNPDSNVEGTIVTLGGHVHDWGTSVAVQKVQTGEWLCTSSAGYATGSGLEPDAIGSPPRPNDAGHPADNLVMNPGDSMYAGHIEEMTACTPNAKIKPGDTLRLHAQYNADATIPDVMGIMNAFVYDNCGGLSNPDQHDTDADLLGDPCDPDIDGDSIANGSDPEADGDGLSNTLETACGSNPMHGLWKPERVDATFAGVDDDGDALTDEALPGGALNSDCDGDGYKGSAENNVFSYLSQTNGDQKRCLENDTAFPGGAAHIRPSKRWPSDIATIGAFSANKINVQDISSFVSPIRYLNKNVGSNASDVRFDLVQGPGPFGVDINVGDLAALTSGTTGFPPMFGGATRAFNGPVCPTPQ